MSVKSKLHGWHKITRNEETMAFGAWLSKLRITRNLSRTDVAKLISTSTDIVKRIEQGYIHPSTANYKKRIEEGLKRGSMRIEL
ncbi:helix-turn-helix domain-containing protein [Priestia aryabhattai]|uniref:helix-turn-helix domain-containing protein n=1 Tax=Priestia aryabhattai TaxID=412384 RepID=UPI003C8B93D3